MEPATETSHKVAQAYFALKLKIAVTTVPISVVFLAEMDTLCHFFVTG